MISLNESVSVLLLVLLLVVQVLSVPVSNVPAPIKNVPSVEAFNFMKRFGYLEEGSGDVEALYSKEAVVDAIKNVQKFGALPQTGVIDNATLELFTAPRCGVSDILRNQRNKRFTVGSRGWRKRRLSYHIENWSPLLGQRKVAKNIQRALDTWGKYGKLVFNRVNDPNADIIVSFKSGDHGDHFPFDGPGNILAHAFFPNDGDIHFDSDEHWNTFDGDGSKPGTDFFTVAVHELGHSLGLAHSPVRTSIMFPYYTGYKPQLSLDYDDIMGMYELYIRGLPEIPYEPESATESEFGPEETTPKTIYPEAPVDGDIDGVNRPPFIPKVTTTRRPEKRPSRPQLPQVPDICEGNYDAIALLRGELFVFKNEYIWRLQDRNVITPGYPVLIRQMFSKLPEEVKQVDAAYERPDGMIVLFTGNHYWVTNGNDLIENSPQPLANYGLPANLDKLDAAQLWKRNGKTYFYKNDHFWRYDDSTRTMDAGYPKSMTKWRGVPNNIDAVITWKDGYTYFFKGKHYYKFDNDWIVVTDTSPMPSPQTWLGCPERQDVHDYYSRS